ncbi:MAG: hypothetical protein LBP52_01885 [Burkholderiaceae bacterium]|nr:hypothetical protein [Burkholderiaceae bacterium]
MNPKPTLLRRGLLAATVACAALSVAAAPAHAAISITDADEDSFRYANAPGWTTILGTGAWKPVLTAGSIDPPTNGWLRLTEPAPYHAGTAVYNTAFSSAEGLQITFDYASYGNNPNNGDGMTFYLIDGSTATPTLGYHSATLGYTLALPTMLGVTNGYVGIGLDEYGGFSALPHLGQGCAVACSLSRKPQSVAVRGAGSLDKGFPLLASVSLPNDFPALGQISTAQADRSDARTVRITISPVTPAAPYPKITVEIIDPNTGNFVTVIDALDLSNNGPVPKTFKMGFSAASGGGLRSYHEVRIRSARTLVSAVPTVGQSTLGALAVLLALLALPALRWRIRN